MPEDERADAVGAAMDLALLNVARLRAPLDSPIVAEFVAGIDGINRLAERSEGFVWRDAGAHDGLPAVTPEDDLLVVNLSTWRSYEDLHRFVYRSAHGGYVRRRSRWFTRLDGPAIALWWVEAGHRPTTDEAFARLDHLRASGPTAVAFTPLRRFDASGRPLRPAGAGRAGPPSRRGR